MAGSTIELGFFHEPVQAARVDLLLHLQVPLSCIKRLEPGPKLGPLFGRQALDRGFYLLDCGH